MSRLQNKCLIVSVAMHVLLIAVLLLAPAFQKEEPKPDPPKPVNLIHGALVAKALQAAAAAPARPVQEPPKAPEPKPKPPEPKPKPLEPKPKKVEQPKPQPKPQPKKTTPKKATPKKPAPKKTTVKPKISKPKITKPKVTPKPRPRPKIKVNIPTQLQTKRDPAQEQREREAEARRIREAKEKAERDRARLRTRLASATNLKFSKSVSPRISGGSSRATQDYGSRVVSTYNREWREPAGISSASIVTVTVTISKSGYVKSARISKRSSNSTLNSSIQSLINRVKKFPAFPPGMNQSEFTLSIDFEMQNR